MPSSEYQVNITISTKDKTSGEAKKAASSLDQLQKAAKLVAAGFAAMKTAQAVVELVKLGAASQRQETALGNLAKAAGTSGEAIVKAIQVASDFTIDRMTAMQVANRAMIMDVAESPAQFERLTKVAVALGRAMGVDAATSIDNFVTAAGRQSRMVADNLGLIVKAEDAYQHYATQLGKTAEELTDTEKKQAFLNEMLRQGEIKMAALGESGIDNAAQMEIANAAWKDAKTSVGGLLATLAEATGILDAVAGWSRDTADATRAIEQHGFSVEAWAKAIRTYMTTLDRTEAIERYIDEVEAAANATVKVTKETSFGFGPAITTLHGKVRDINPEIDRYRNAIEESSEVSRYMHTVELPQLAEKFGATDEATLEYLESLGETVDMGRDFVAGATGIIEVLQDQRREMMNTAEKTVALAMSYTSYQEDVTDSAADFTERRAVIEAKHQEKLTKIHKEGAGWREAIDEEGARLEVRIAQGRLDELLAKQGEFNEETSDLERARTEQSIRQYQQEINDKTTLLGRAHDGYVTMTGKNVDDLLGEEKRHYQESLVELDKAEAAQEASQKQSLGRMILAHFDAWVEMNLATEGFTSEEAKFVTTMRTNIAKEYGLMTDAAVKELNAQESEWRGMWAMAQEGAKGTYTELGKVIARLNEMPSEKRIRIIYELSQPDPPGPGGGIPKQHGGPVKEGLPYIVGERGPELFVPGSAGQIINNTRTTNILNQNTGMRVMPQSGSGAVRPITIHNHFGPGSVRSDRDVYRVVELQEKSLRLRGVGAIA